MPVSVPALLDEAVGDSPDAVLWEFFDEGTQATYAEVQLESRRFAAMLATLGVKRGDKVAVMLPNVAEMPLVWLALGRLGAVMVPVNIRYSPRELDYLVGNAGATYLIIHQELTDVLGQANSTAETLVVGSDDWAQRLLHADAAGCPDVAVDRDDLMNIQYTSGTTGLPKGCLLTHRYWLTTGMVNAWRDGQRFRRILATTPFSYMDPQWLLVMAIYQRGTLVVGRKQSATKFSGWLSSHRIEFCLFPEAASKQPPAPHDADNPVVRANIYGIRASAHAEIQKRYGLVAREAFGMTEIGSGLYMPMEAEDMVGSGSCGIASPFRETRIVDDSGQDVPQGETGELLLRGPGMTLGYHDNPEATAQGLAGGWFHTGDLFRCDERGYHFIVGRKKDMIRRSGENIACREVEGVLRDIEDIEEVALIPVPDDLRGEEVKAFISLKKGLSADDALIARIVDYARHRLAPFKVPRYFEFIETMPRTTSYKVAKSELVKARDDQRIGSFDRVDNLWR